MVKERNRPVWAVIPIYHPDRKQFAELLDAIHADRIIVVNNNREKIKFPPKVLEILPRDNTGYARGVNLGIKKAVHNGAEWIVVLNQDVSMPASVWPILVRHLKILPPSVSGPFTGKLDPVRWSTQINESRPSKTQAPVRYVSGSFMVLHRDVIKSCGMFHEPYFMYYEDADICLTAAQAGIPVLRLPLAGVRHNAEYDQSGERQKAYYLARNHLLFVRRHAPPRVRLREYIRLPKTLYEHVVHKDAAGVRGVLDFCIRRYGRSGGTA